MNEEFNKEFMKLNEKDQKSILNLIQLKNMNKQTEYKRRIDKALRKLQLLIDIGFDYDGLNQVDSLKTLIDELVSYAVDSRNILKGEDNNE